MKEDSQEQQNNMTNQKTTQEIKEEIDRVMEEHRDEYAALGTLSKEGKVDQDELKEKYEELNKKSGLLTLMEQLTLTHENNNDEK